MAHELFGRDVNRAGPRARLAIGAANAFEQMRLAGADRTMDEQRRVHARLFGRHLRRFVCQAIRVAHDECVQGREATACRGLGAGIRVRGRQGAGFARRGAADRGAVFDGRCGRLGRGDRRGRRGGRNAKLQRQGLVKNLERRGFEILAEMGTQPILKELVGHADYEILAANGKLGGRAKPDFVPVFADAVRQSGTNNRYDFPIVRDHFLCTPSAHFHRRYWHRLDVKLSR